MVLWTSPNAVSPGNLQGGFMEWTCGHNSNGVCGECYRRLAWRAHCLAEQLLKLEDILGTKLKPGKFDCFENAAPDEPMFVLLARDKSAPEIVRIWAYQRRVDILKGDKPDEDMKMVEEAMECAANMEKWRHDNRGPG